MKTIIFLINNMKITNKKTQNRAEKERGGEDREIPFTGDSGYPKAQKNNYQSTCILNQDCRELNSSWQGFYIYAEINNKMGKRCFKPRYLLYHANPGGLERDGQQFS